MLTAVSALAADVEVILTTRGPANDVGVSGRTLLSFNTSGGQSFSLSEDGSWWAINALLDTTSNPANRNVHLRGQGGAFVNTMIQDNVTLMPTFPGVSATSLIDLPASTTAQPAVNNSGEVVGYFENAAASEPDRFIYQYDGSTLSIAAGATQVIPAAAYGTPGSETYGTAVGALHSPNALASGQAAFVAESTSGTVPVGQNSLALTNNGATLAGPQEGVTVYPNGTLQAFDLNEFLFSEDGTKFLYKGDTDGAVATDAFVAFGSVGTAGSIVLQEGTTPIGAGTFTDVYQLDIAPNGDWYASGFATGAIQFAMKNGSILQKTGDAAPGGGLYTTILGGDVDGDASGNFVTLWGTDGDAASNEILVYNESNVILREGDLITVDVGDGPESLFIDEFATGATKLSDDGWIYTMVTLSSVPGNTPPQAGFLRGQAFIRVRAIPEPSSIALVVSGLALCGVAGYRRRQSVG